MKKSEARLSQVGQAVSSLILDRKTNVRSAAIKDDAPLVSYAVGKTMVRKPAAKKEWKASSVSVERVVKSTESGE